MARGGGATKAWAESVAARGCEGELGPGGSVEEGPVGAFLVLGSPVQRYEVPVMFSKGGLLL